MYHFAYILLETSIIHILVIKTIQAESILCCQGKATKGLFNSVSTVSQVSTWSSKNGFPSTRRRPSGSIRNLHWIRKRPKLLWHSIQLFPSVFWEVYFVDNRQLCSPPGKKAELVKMWQMQISVRIWANTSLWLLHSLLFRNILWYLKYTFTVKKNHKENIKNYFISG